jgi:hypothetical protein
MTLAAYLHWISDNVLFIYFNRWVLWKARTGKTCIPGCVREVVARIGEQIEHVALCVSLLDGLVLCCDDWAHVRVQRPNNK